MTKKPYAYCHYSNGDYDDKVWDINDLCASIDFELNAGCQEYIIITRRKLSSDEYVRLCEILDKKPNPHKPYPEMPSDVWDKKG